MHYPSYSCLVRNLTYIAKIGAKSKKPSRRLMAVMI